MATEIREVETDTPVVPTATGARERVRVAFVSFEFPPHIGGGAGTYAAEVVPLLAEAGCDVTLFTLRGATTVDTVSLEEVSDPSRGALGFWLSLPRVFARAVHATGPFDILHSNGISDFTIFWPRTPRVVTVHHVTAALLPSGLSQIPVRFQELHGELGIPPSLEGPIARRADRVIVHTKGSAADLQRVHSVPASRIQVLGLGVNRPVPPEPARVEEMRSRLLAEQPGDSLFLSVGRLEHRKGVDILLHALAVAIGSGSHITLAVAGAGESSAYGELANRLGIAGQVRFLGRVGRDDLEVLYSAADVYVAAPRFEGFGLTWAEAMIRGKAVVVTATGAALDQLSGHDVGFVVPVEDAAALGEAMSLAASNRDGMLRTGQRNQEFAFEHLGWATHVDGLLDVYHSLASARR